MEGSPVVMMGTGIDQRLQIPTEAAAVLVAAEGIAVGMGNEGDHDLRDHTLADCEY